MARRRAEVERRSHQPSPTHETIQTNRSFISYISEITDRYVIAANNPISLVGTVADAAYVVVGDRSVTQHPRQ